MIVEASAPSELQCDHCGLPVPLGLVNEEHEHQFCCSGCEGAFHLIRESGLDAFYRMTDSGDSMTLKNRADSKLQFHEFDSLTFQEKFASQSDSGSAEIKLALDGIHCAACIWLIEKLPNILPGVTEARVNWSRGTVLVRWCEDQVQLSSIAQALFQLGYRPYPVRQSENAKRFERENRSHLVRIGVAGALAGNNMVISAALYFGMFAHMTAGMETLMRVTSCVVGLAAMLIPGRVFLTSAINALKTRTPHMDLPIALALVVGSTVGTINVIRGIGDVYFDSLSVLVFLLLIGRWLQFRQQSKAADAVELLYRMTPRMTTKIVDGQPVEVHVDAVEVRDLLRVQPGELIPVDGKVTEGRTSVDESILTGESIDIEKEIGDEVFAGTLNRSSMVQIEASQVGDQTRLSKIAELVEASGSNRPQIVQWADQVGGWFVFVLLLLAGLTFVYWLPGDLGVSVDRTMALLIVACPCALALATPLTIAVALGRAAREKIMVKNGDVLQSLQEPGIIWLDKTGTITEGSLRVEQWRGDGSILPILARVEAESRHPVAKALVRFANETSARPISDKEHFNIEEHFGLGVVATAGPSRYVIGNRELLEQQDVPISECDEVTARELASSGLSPCWVVANGQVVGMAGIGDAIRSESKQVVSRLRAHGWQVGILSGDHQSVVDRVAKRLDIDSALAIGETTPEEKLTRIQESASSLTTIMVGDGVNDSGALAASTVGIAVKGGAEASLAAAQVYLGKPGLVPILELIEYCHAATKKMRWNLAISLAYNVCFAALAFAGYVNPLVAAVLMPLSSLSVVSLAMIGAQSKTYSKGIS